MVEKRRVFDLTGSQTAAVQSIVKSLIKWAVPLHHHLQFYFSKHILKIILFMYTYTDTHFFWNALIILILWQRSPTFLILFSKHNLLTDFMEQSSLTSKQLFCWSWNFLYFMESKGLLLYSQDPDTALYPEPPVHTLTPHFNIIHVYPGLLNGIFPSKHSILPFHNAI
jgi:hypothetical protein